MSDEDVDDDPDFEDFVCDTISEDRVRILSDYCNRNMDKPAGANVSSVLSEEEIILAKDLLREAISKRRLRLREHYLVCDIGPLLLENGDLYTGATRWYKVPIPIKYYSEGLILDGLVHAFCDEENYYWCSLKGCEKKGYLLWDPILESDTRYRRLLQFEFDIVKP